MSAIVGAVVIVGVILAGLVGVWIDRRYDGAGQRRDERGRS